MRLGFHVSISGGFSLSVQRAYETRLHLHADLQQEPARLDRKAAR